MGMEQHISALKAKHADIDKQILDFESGASTDSVEISRLKAMKLSLKDEIEKLQNEEK